MTTLKSATTKPKGVRSTTGFDWKIDADQTYGPNDPPTAVGKPGDFNKLLPFSFTMDAPGRTLTLLAETPASGITVWGQGVQGEIGDGPCLFDIRSGTFIYDGNASTGLVMGQSGSGSDGLYGSKLIVRSTATFAVQNTNYILAPENFELRVQDSGTVTMAARTIQLDGFDAEASVIQLVDQARMLLSGDAVWIETLPLTLADNAQMSITAGSVTFGDSDDTGIVTVASSPASLASLDYSPDCASATTTKIFTKPMYFSGTSRSRFRGPKLQIQNTLMEASDHAMLHLQFDSFDIHGDRPFNMLARFLLKPDEAMILLDGYTVNDPFDFRNKASDYPEGLFEIRTGTSGARSNSEFVIKNQAAAFGFAAMIGAKLISIDDELQTDSRGLDVSYDPLGYTHIKLKAK
jgi:hypothetical protein